MRKLIFIIAIFGFLLTGCVKDTAQLVLKSISFTPDTLKIPAGAAVKLSPVFYPATFSSIAVEWSSADGNLASVSEAGWVNAVKPGNVWVTIKDKNSATVGRCYVIIQ